MIIILKKKYIIALKKSLLPSSWNNSKLKADNVVKLPNKPTYINTYAEFWNFPKKKPANEDPITFTMIVDKGMPKADKLIK